MSEQPLNTDPLATKLARFTPNAAGFDRDALLFEAGRASAPSPRMWQGLAGLLLVAQSLTLALYFTKPAMIQLPAAPVQPVAKPPLNDDVQRAPPAAEPSPPSPYFRALLTGNIGELPRTIPEADAILPEKIWTVRSMSSAVIID